MIASGRADTVIRGTDQRAAFDQVIDHRAPAKPDANAVPKRPQVDHIAEQTVQFSGWCKHQPAIGEKPIPVMNVFAA